MQSSEIADRVTAFNQELGDYFRFADYPTDTPTCGQRGQLASLW